jgi:CspA family cold shock protein
MSTTTDVVTPSDRLTGRVKWFNNKAGYGFVTVTDGDHSGNDIFVHHSAIHVEDQQYKYLVQGEYVEFVLTKTTSGDHEWQASNISGIKGGKLMCETRHDFKVARYAYKSDDKDASPAPRMPRQQRVPREESGSRDKSETRPLRQSRAPRARGEGPREQNTGDKKEWTLVTNKNTSKPRSKKPAASSTPDEAK